MINTSEEALFSYDLPSYFRGMRVVDVQTSRQRMREQKPDHQFIRNSDKFDSAGRKPDHLK